ncbi:MAG: PAS domain-containing protein, partial [Aliifodinibius sp.]|nr:PAS domain-containing protein [Fodinibius sp.]NIV11585.1 PAS domain-containing protein [Fodinibius sp.]NIY25194.1 PAS domain-containing protein [Fodinibius sp.]
MKTNIAPPSALLIYGQNPHNFSKREINLLVNFANHATMAIENAELYRRSDENLERQTRRLVSLIHSLDNGLILEDLSGKIIHINRSACELVGITENDVINTPITRYFEELLKKRNSNDITLDHIRKSLLSSNTDQIIEIDIHTQGRKRIIRINGFNVSNSSNRIIGQGQILRDITQ